MDSYEKQEGCPEHRQGNRNEKILLIFLEHDKIFFLDENTDAITFFAFFDASQQTPPSLALVIKGERVLNFRLLLPNRQRCGKNSFSDSGGTRHVLTGVAHGHCPAIYPQEINKHVGVGK